MKKLDIKGIFTRPRKLLLHPEMEWQVIGRENIEGIELFKNFLVPLSVLSSVCAILLNLTSLRHWNRYHPVHGLRRGELHRLPGVP